MGSTNPSDVFAPRSYRQTSERFVQIPWYTKILLGNDEDIQQFGVMQPQFEKLATQILSFQNSKTAPSNENRVWRDWMAGGNENENSLPLPSKGYWTQGRGLAIEAILSHRVLDIACLLHGGSTANPPRVSAALDSAVFERFNKAVFGTSGTRNWVDLLQTAIKIVAQFPDVKAPTNAPAGGSANAVLESPAVKLFRSAVLRQNEALGAAIFANFELAALHLHRILTTGDMQTRSLLEIGGQLGIKFTENDQELMKSNLSKADFEKPLFLSLATSPLILLRSTLLTKKTLNKGDIFEKDPEFQRVNKALWKVLFDRANGKASVECFHEFFKEVTMYSDVKCEIKNPKQLFFEGYSLKPVLPREISDIDIVVGVKRSPPNLLSSPPNPKRVKMVEESDDINIVVAMNEVSLSHAARPHVDVSMDDEMALSDPLVDHAHRGTVSNLHEVAFQEEAPLEWKGKGKETSMEVDNSEDGEIPMDISCSEEGQTPPSRKRSSRLIHKTTPALKDQPPKSPVVKAMVATKGPPPVAETGKMDKNARNTPKNVEKPSQTNKTAQSDLDRRSKKETWKNPDKTGKRSSDKQLGSLSKPVKTKNTDHEQDTEPTNLASGKKLGGPSKSVTTKDPEQRRAPRDLISEEKLGGPSKPVTTKKSEKREATTHSVKEQVSGSKNKLPIQKRSQSVAAKDFSNYQPHEEDLKGWSEVTLDNKFGKPRHKGQAPLLYAKPGSPEDFFAYTPEAHFQDELKWIYDVHELAQSSYFADHPRFVSQPETSCLEEVSRNQWEQLDPYAKQKLLRTKDVHIYDRNQAGRPFNEHSLLRITESMTTVFTVHDHSTRGFERRAKQGNLDLVYQHSKAASGSILNCLDLPGGNREPDRDISTDKTAFLATQGLEHCVRSSFPQESMRFTLCGLAHCNTRFHIDCEGFSTSLEVYCGKKVIFLATPIGDHSIGEINTFSDSRYDADKPPNAHWVIEPVLLLPGSTIYIRPCRPHAVVTLEHSICEGGHTYTHSTLQESCFGIFHTFVESRLLTNAEHAWESRELLRRIVTYYHLHFVSKVLQSPLVNHHLPDLTQIPDLINLLCLLNVVILGHIIYPPSYDEIMVQSDPPKEFLFKIGREKAQELLTTLSMDLKIVKSGRRVEFKPYFVTYFVQQVRSLIRHHSQSSKFHSKPMGESISCTTTALCQEIAASLAENDWFTREVRRQKKIGFPDTTYAWVAEDDLIIETNMVDDISAEELDDDHSFDVAFPNPVFYDEGNAKMKKLFLFLTEGIL